MSRPVRDPPLKSGLALRPIVNAVRGWSSPVRIPVRTRAAHPVS